MSSPILDNRILFHDDNPRPLGRITLAATQHNSRGIGSPHMRVYGQYAVVLLVSGSGYYRDALGTHKSVTPGDLIVVFPEIAHSYGPTPGSHWDEIYVCFEGDIFDLWRRHNLLDPLRPVVTIENWRPFLQETSALLQERPTTQGQHMALLHRFLMLLGTVLPDASTTTEPQWITRAKSILQSDLDQDLSGEELARRVGLSYQTFRKSFARECGISPSQFRARQRVETAKTLLTGTSMTHRAIARTLGFRDEAHFARRFKEVTGQTPRDYRRTAK